LEPFTLTLFVYPSTSNPFALLPLTLVLQLLPQSTVGTLQ
jgi:hypothetical protein